MKICYLTQSVIPSSTADSVQSMHMCHGLVQAGHEVILVAPDRPLPEPVSGEAHAYYGVPASFEIEKIPWTLIAGRAYLYGYQAARRCARIRPEIVYSRSLWEAMFAAWLGLPTVFEAHGAVGGRISGSFLPRFLKSKNLKRVVVISEALKHVFTEQYGYPEKRIVLARDAADVPEAPSTPSAPWPGRPGNLQIGYVGSLVSGRGLDLIGKLASSLPALDFHILGGTAGQIAHWKNRLAVGNLYFRGNKDPGEIPAHLQAFDILLAPYQQKVSIGLGDYETTQWMSPMKLFEYMAAGKAIVCSDLPALREFMVHHENCLLCPPDDAAAWQAALVLLAGDPALRQRLGACARREVEEKYTWKKRGEIVLEGLGS